MRLSVYLQSLNQIFTLRAAMKRRNIKFATICLSLLVGRVSISMIGSSASHRKRLCSTFRTTKGEKATPKELVTTGMLNATSNATKPPSAVR